MKSHELLNITDHIEESIEDIREYLADHPHLLLETEGHSRISTFLKFHLTHSEQAAIGEMYVPIQITSQSFAAALFIRHTQHLAKLIDIDSVNKAYLFEYNGKLEKFPSGERKMGDITQYCLLYGSISAAEELLSMIKLSFNDWDIKIKAI